MLDHMRISEMNFLKKRISESEGGFGALRHLLQGGIQAPHVVCVDATVAAQQVSPVLAHLALVALLPLLLPPQVSLPSPPGLVRRVVVHEAPVHRGPQGGAS